MEPGEEEVRRLDADPRKLWPWWGDWCKVVGDIDRWAAQENARRAARLEENRGREFTVLAVLVDDVVRAARAALRRHEARYTEDLQLWRAIQALAGVSGEP